MATEVLLPSFPGTGEPTDFNKKKMYVRLIYIYIIVRGFVFKNDCPRKIGTGSLRGHGKRHGRPLFVLVTIRNHS